MAIAHPEVFSIADYLTIREENSDKVLYQPSVYFVYLPCDSAVCSLNEWRMKGYPSLETERIMCDDIVSGADELGVLLLGGHEISAWWTGSVLDIDQTRHLVNKQSATTLQVAIAAVAGVIYALKNPREGVRFPEQLDSEKILETAIPFLGTWISKAIDWPLTLVPLENSEQESTLKEIDEGTTRDSQWNFSTFRVDASTL